MGSWVQNEKGSHFRLTKSEAQFLSGKIVMLLQLDDRLRGRNLNTIKQLAEQMGAVPALAPSPDTHRPRRTPSRSNSGPVVITKPDGSVITRRAHSQKQLRRIAPERLPINQTMRARVLHRDRQTCRYCGNIDGPFEIDHVIPVTLGGATKLWNLVTACCECNRRKGALVWKPRPLNVAG